MMMTAKIIFVLATPPSKSVFPLFRYAQPPNIHLPQKCVHEQEIDADSFCRVTRQLQYYIRLQSIWEFPRVVAVGHYCS